jgi:hypothetical protein
MAIHYMDQPSRFPQSPLSPSGRSRLQAGNQRFCRLFALLGTVSGYQCTKSAMKPGPYLVAIR